MEPVPLAGGGVVLTTLRDDDIDLIVEYCRDPLFERFMATPWPYERTHAEWFVRGYAQGGWARGDEPTWAIRGEADGELWGAIGVRVPSGSVGYWLGAPHRGRGIMRAAFDAVADFAFAPEGLALPRLTWECAIGNLASAALARSVGFRYDGEALGEVPTRDGTRQPAWTGSMTPADRGTRSEWPMLP